MKLVPLLAAAAFAVLATPAMAHDGPSFDCAKAATAIEMTICADPQLAADDALMARLYAAARVSAFGSGPSNVTAGQRQWLKDRGTCSSPDPRIWTSIGACLGEFNKRRLSELAVAALFAMPDLALATLRRTDPGAAPLYEAIWLWASAEPGREPRERIAPLIAPELAPGEGAGDHAWGHDLLREEGLDSIDKVLESDASFASFLQHVSPYLKSETYGLPLPCAAIVRRPGLLGATAPLFGSSLDNGIMMADCDQTLPPTPKFDALVAGIWRSWPDCDGTIRFSYYKTFAYRVTAARLGIEPAPGDDPVDDPGRLPPGASRQAVAGAIYELAAIYRQYRGLSLVEARALAERRMADMMTSGGQCDFGEY